MFFSQLYQQETIKSYQNFLERSVYWNEYKTKSEKKNTTNEYRYFPESNFVGVSRLFVLVYSDQDADSKIFKTREDIIYQKELLIIIPSSSMEKLLWPTH